MAYPLFHPESVEPVPVFLSADAFRAAFPGESEFVEFKQGIAADQIQQVAVAFSNVDGGVLLVGVAPDGRVVGVADSAVTRDRIYGALGLARQLGRYALDALDVDGSVSTRSRSRVGGKGPRRRTMAACWFGAAPRKSRSSAMNCSP